MRFGVLGPLVVWDNTGGTVRVPETKVRALLADLLAHDGGPVPVDRLIHDLWGDRPPARPSGALQARVSQLRRVVGRDRVVRRPPGYELRLDESADGTDASRFRALVAQARTARDAYARVALLTEALGLWRGPAYADFADEEFVRGAAQHLAEQRLSVVEEQAQARLDSGDQVLVAGELTEHVARHPLRESLRAVQMRALYAAGRQSEALATYEDLRSRLAGELGVAPGPGLGALHLAVLRQDPELAPAQPREPEPYAPGSGGRARTSAAARPRQDRCHSGPPADAGAPSAAARSNLPAPLTPLIGRRQSLLGLSALLRTARLVTLTGPGGVGKTRLAVAAAAADAAAGASVRAAVPEAGELADGVWLVEFAGVRSGTPADLSQVVAATLGIRDGAPAAPLGAGSSGLLPVHRLAAALRDRRTLLVLDNCEHVVDAAAELVALLLRTAPGLRVLVTSQEPLGLAGEAVFLVEPLPAADAVQLFMERAAASAPGFPQDPAACDPSDRAAVDEICRRLDGIPLALELAATRVRALGVRELADRLGCRFQVLTSGQRGAPARQQTLRAVIDWSWELLSAPERAFLRRLAVHSGGCDLAAAEAVGSGDGVDRQNVLDLMSRLVERSLVEGVDGPAGRRYRLLESVAAYAMERLYEAGELATVRDRHRRHYLALAERAESGLRGAGQRSWLARLDADSGNLRAALDEAVRRAAAGEPDEAARSAAALAWWWLLRGRLTEGRRSLAAVLAAVSGGAAPEGVGTGGGGREDAAPADAALEHPDPDPDPDDTVTGGGGPASGAAGVSATAELSLLQAAFALLTGGRDAAAVSVTASAGRVPDPVRRARALWLCAYGLFSAGVTADSGELNARALTLFTSAGDQWGTAAALGLRATLALVGGDLAGLGRDGLRSLTLFRELGDSWGELQSVSPLAVLAEIKGDYEDAARRQHEGLRIAEELGLRAEVSARLSGLGRLSLLARDWGRARDLHQQARRIAVEQGYTYGEIHAEMGLALGARRSGDLDTAEAHLLHIRDGYADVSSQAGDHLLCAELGFIAELRGDAVRAVHHHLRGLDIARALGEPRALALSLEGLAGAVTPHGHARSAGYTALLLGAADAARRRAGAPLPSAERGDADRIGAAARAVLGEPAFSEAFERGARLTPGGAALYARTALDRPG